MNFLRRIAPSRNRITRPKVAACASVSCTVSWSGEQKTDLSDSDPPSTSVADVAAPRHATERECLDTRGHSFRHAMQPLCCTYLPDASTLGHARIDPLKEPSTRDLLKCPGHSGDNGGCRKCLNDGPVEEGPE